MAAAKRNEVIDGFRGVAILAVMAYHYLFRWQHELAQPATPVWLQLGALGVQIFFVVSGLVITMTLLRSHDAFSFAIRRAARLVPAYWLAATLIFAILRCYDPVGFRPTLPDYLTTLGFASFDLHRQFVDGAFWSLNIEVKFYALSALSYLVLRERFWIGLIAFAVLGIAASFVTPAGQNLIFLGPYMPFFLWGLALWYGFFQHERRTAWICGLAALLCYPSHHGFYSYPGLAWWAPHLFLAAGIAALTGMIAFAPGTPMGPLAWLGRISYSLYLIHQRLGVALIATLLPLGLPQAAAVGVTVAAAVLLAWSFYRLVELPGQAVVLRLFDFHLRKPRPHLLPDEEVGVAPEHPGAGAASGA